MKLTSGSAARRKKVVVVGAGIGGLTAAVALHRSGHEVQVFERARQLGEVGAGLQLGPNAVRIVEALGLGQELHRLAAEPTERVSLKWDTGEQRVREPYKGVMRQRFGAPYLMAHRADVHSLLMRQLPDGCIRTGAECVEVVTSPASASARFADGSAVEADVVVGADGIHSMVRNSLFDPVRPRFTQQICWRVVLPMDAIRRAPALPQPLTGMEYTGWLGPTGHVLFYPLRGGELLNIFAGRVSSDWVGESWTVDSSVPEMLQAYAGWNDGMLEVLSQATNAYCWGIHDRDPLASWTKGRVTLLGDAAQLSPVHAPASRMPACPERLRRQRRPAGLAQSGRGLRGHRRRHVLHPGARHSRLRPFAQRGRRGQRPPAHLGSRPRHVPGFQPAGHRGRRQ